MNLTKSFLIVIMLLASLASNCEPDTKVVIEGYNSPMFKISGHGSLDSIRVSGPDLKGKAPDGSLPYMDVYWEIAPKSEMDVGQVEKQGAITYGKIPDGFVQRYPESGEALPLFEGGNFNIHLLIKDAGGVNMFFTLHDGKIMAEGYNH
jgi:hypothetical protein